eukprot:RCo030216
MAENWEERRTPCGKTVYFNKVTGTGQWKKPVELGGDPNAEPDAPPCAGSGKCAKSGGCSGGGGGGGCCGGGCGKAAKEPAKKPAEAAAPGDKVKVPLQDEDLH